MTLTADTAVFGSGAVALAHALFQARHGPVILAGRPETGAPGVERVPAPLLALLLELGVVPGQLDIDRLTRSRFVAWEEMEPTERLGPACAHLDRSALVEVLWRRVGECAEIHVVPPLVRGLGVARAGEGWRARHLVDATGRRSLSATGRIHPAPAWVATSCTVPRCGVDPTMQMAAGPGGYAYRLGSARWLTVAWVGPGSPPTDVASLADRIDGQGLGWLTADLDLSGAPVERRTASVSIAGARDDHRVIALGDAALSRDALASQGLAIGLSDARLAAGCADPAMLAARRAEGLERHLRHLSDMLATGHHHDSGPWLAYRRWVQVRASLGGAEMILATPR